MLEVTGEMEPLDGGLGQQGAFRAGVSGAGPALYGLFAERADSDKAARQLRRFGATWSTVPVWCG